MNVAAVDEPVPMRPLPHRWVVPLVALALLAGGGAVIQAGNSVLRDLGMVAIPQRYVALSLSNPTALPVRVAPGTPIAFDFAISNSTTAAVNQRWVVDVSGTGLADQEIAHGSTRVSPGASVTIPVHSEMPDVHSEATFRISAPGRSLAPLEFHVAPAPDGVTP